MKITMLIEVTNPQSNGKLIAAELRRQGHQVQTLNMVSDGDYLVNEIFGFRPDTVIGTHTHRSLSKEIIWRIKHTPSHPVAVLWYVDAYSPKDTVGGENFEKTKGIYDLMLVSVKGLVKDFQEFNYAHRIVWVPQYFDNTFFKPTIERTNEYDVCFLGNVYPAASYRFDYLRILESNFKTLKGGYGFGRVITGRESADFYMKSKIAIDIPSFLPGRELLMSERIFKAMGLGCLFLSQNVVGLKQLFTPGLHLDVYGDTMGGLCKKVEYYLNHPDELKKIAEAGQREVLEKHTISVRVKRYLKVIEEEIRKR